MATRRKRKHRERLSEKTPKGDAIVRSHTNRKYERLAEMTIPVRKMDGNKKVATLTHCVRTLAQLKLLLIDSNAEMPTRRNLRRTVND